MEHPIGQFEFFWRFLTAFGTSLARLVRWHLMEVFAISLCNPLAPVKEHAPRSIRDRLGKVSVLHHIAGLKFLGNNCIKTFMVEKRVSRFCEKVETLASDNICLFCQRVFCFIPSLALILLPRKSALKFHEFAFCRAIEARIGGLLTLRGRQKVVCPDIHTTSGLRDTRQGIRHFTNDKAIPAACRLFQCDLFRVSTEGTMLTDFDFTKFWDFQSVQARACGANRILPNTFTTLEFMLSQTPRYRANRPFEFRVSFLSLCRVFTPPKEVIVCGIKPLDCGHLHVLRVFRVICVILAQVRKVIDLVNARHRDRAVSIHLRAHLKHIVIQLLLMLEFSIQPAFLVASRVDPIFIRAFHWTVTYHVFNPCIVGRQTRYQAVTLYMSANVIS